MDAKDSLLIFGPRGTGKTAWLKNHMQEQEHLYLDLLDNATFRLLLAQPEKLSELIKPNFRGWVIIDEIQKVPAFQRSWGMTSS
ncbi:MAG: AAA family ATPase, partial [Gammaproteobacteria bacterium]|nr:AAA family ATPase [Gammaproteobacteria bacterium]MCD8542434.1 AAA family ATPase [Gammaproteobacteria bacterium]